MELDDVETKAGAIAKSTIQEVRSSMKMG